MAHPRGQRRGDRHFRGDLLAAGQCEKVEKTLPIRHFTDVDGMADFALRLVSPLCRYLTGQVVALDGGMMFAPMQS